MIHKFTKKLLVLLIELAIDVYYEFNKRRATTIQCQTFNVNVGLNYSGELCHDIVYEDFIALNKYFEVFFFLGTYNVYNNIITYRFRVFNLINPSYSRHHILNIARRIGEKVLHQHFIQTRQYNLTANRFVAASWCADELDIHYATNEDGLKTIEELRKNSH